MNNYTIDGGEGREGEKEREKEGGREGGEVNNNS